MTNQTNLTQTALPLEEILRKQIYDALQGDVVEVILKEAKVRKTDNHWRYLLEGHSFKVDEKISKKLFDIFQSVKAQLGFNDKVDFYISSASEVNAFALSSFEEDEPHIININSSLLQLMNDEELRFIIGHELGHLINKNADLLKLIQFIFPPSTNLPGILQHKIRLWSQLSELNADRFGYLVCPDLKTCISAFFKMSSGLDAKRVDLNIDAFLEENEKRLEFFQKDSGMNIASHPINPIRVKAIELFSRSEYFAQNNNPETRLNDEELQKQMDELTEVLLKIKNTDLDYYITQFVASAGLIIAGLDGEIDEKEIEVIMHALSDFSIFPRGYLNYVYESGKVNELFNEAITRILQINPGEKETLMNYMINMVMSDKKIKPDEFGFIFEIGTKGFGLTSKEVAQIFASVIQQRFVPSIHDLG